MGTKGREIIESRGIKIPELVALLNEAFADEWLAYYQYWLGAKVAVYSRNNLDVSGGAYLLKLHSSGGTVAAFYGVASYGSRSKALTAGLGYGISDDDSFANPMLILGGELKIGRSTKLISENWIFGAMESTILSGAVQWTGKHLAADLGIIYAFERENNSATFFPWVGLTYNFGT